MFCLHALLLGHWKRLAGKIPTGVVPAESLLGLLLRLLIGVLLFTLLLYFGDELVRRHLRFNYTDNSANLFVLAAVALVLSRLSVIQRRLLLYWRMSHELDFAERRRRTSLL
jgi:hypothetical protein